MTTLVYDIGEMSQQQKEWEKQKPIEIAKCLQDYKGYSVNFELIKKLQELKNNESK